jgi:outer membrane lipoprotein SlyB
LPIHKYILEEKNMADDEETKKTIGGGVGGLAVGAVLGFVIGGPVGAIIGAVAGGGGGAAVLNKIAKK